MFNYLSNEDRSSLFRQIYHNSFMLHLSLLIFIWQTVMCVYTYICARSNLVQSLSSLLPSSSLYCKCTSPVRVWMCLIKANVRLCVGANKSTEANCIQCLVPSHKRTHRVVNVLCPHTREPSEWSAYMPCL